MSGIAKNMNGINVKRDCCITFIFDITNVNIHHIGDMILIHLSNETALQKPRGTGTLHPGGLDHCTQGDWRITTFRGTTGSLHPGGLEDHYIQAVCDLLT